MKFLAASLAASAAALATAQGTYIGSYNVSMAVSTRTYADLSFDANGVLIAVQEDDGINYIDAMMMPGADRQLMKANNATDIEMAMYDAVDDIRSLKVVNGYGYTLGGSDGYAILDMMDYNNVTIKGTDSSQSMSSKNIHYVDAMNNMAIVSDQDSNYAYVVDTSDMAAPAITELNLGTIASTVSTIDNVQVIDGMIYGFQDVPPTVSIINTAGTEVGTWTTSHVSGEPGDAIYNFIKTAFKIGDKIFMINSNPNGDGMDVLDISDPANPVVTDNYKFEDPAEGEMQTAEFPAVNWSPRGPGMMTADGSRFYFPTNMGIMWFGLDDGDMPYLGCMTETVPQSSEFPFAIYGNDYLAVNPDTVDDDELVRLFDISMDTMSCDPNHSNDGGDDGDDDEHDDDHDHSSSASTLVAGAAAMAAAAFML